MKADKPILVGVVLGSITDEKNARPAKEILEKFKIRFAGTVASAHRSPKRLLSTINLWIARGCQIIIACAGGAAHLAGVIAAETVKPVIAVPISSSPLKGLDSLLSSAQMPPGIPVATMAIDGAANAALQAIAILAIKDDKLFAALLEYRRSLEDRVEDYAKKLAEEFCWPE